MRSSAALPRASFGSERADHTLQPTALVHEVYLRLVDQRQVDWQNRAHSLVSRRRSCAGSWSITPVVTAPVKMSIRSASSRTRIAHLTQRHGAPAHQVLEPAGRGDEDVAPWRAARLWRSMPVPP